MNDKKVEICEAHYDCGECSAYFDQEIKAAVEAAQGAMIEAAAQEILNRQSATGGWLDSPKAVAAAIRNIQTEPMAAALAARDKRIRDDAEEQLYRELESAVRHSLLITGDVERAKTILSDAFTRCRRAARKETP